MFEKQRTIDENDSLYSSRSPLHNQFLKFVVEHRGDPEFDNAMYRCAHKWRNEIGHVGLRYRIVDFAAHGIPLTNIAQQLEVDVKTVKTWLVRFMDGGIEALKDKPRSGRPPKQDKKNKDSKD